MPPFPVVGPKAAAHHRRGEQGGIVLRLAGPAPVRSPGLPAAEIERRSHVELAAVHAPHEGEVDGRAAGMAGPTGEIAEPEQVALIDVGIVFGFAPHVLGVPGPASESGDVCGRSGTIEELYTGRWSGETQ